MKSLYYFIAIALLVCTSTTIFSQKTFYPVPSVHNPLRVNATGRMSAATCDTLNYRNSQKWTYAYYQLANDGSGGYVNGTNIYSEQQKAAYFDASNTLDNFLSKVWIGVYKANSQMQSHLDKIITVSIYDGTSGSPSSVLASKDFKLSDLKVAARDSVFLEVNFTPVALPVSKKFFVSVDFSTLTWPSDSLCLFSNINGESKGNAWEQTSTGTWENFNTGWGLDSVAFHIFPFLSSTSIGCTSSLPLKLLSFTAEKKDGNIFINWNVANESDMLNYEVERSFDNLNFRSIHTEPAINSAAVHTYSYSDKNIFEGFANTVFYRLKQTGIDGYSTYSNVIAITINNKNITVQFTNPFHNVLQLHLQAPSPQQAQISLFDIEGRFTGISKQINLSSGNNSIDLPETNPLSKGVYLLRIIVNNQHLNYKVIKN